MMRRPGKRRRKCCSSCGVRAISGISTRVCRSRASIASIRRRYSSVLPLPVTPWIRWTPNCPSAGSRRSSAACCSAVAAGGGVVCSASRVAGATRDQAAQPAVTSAAAWRPCFCARKASRDSGAARKASSSARCALARAAGCAARPASVKHQPGRIGDKRCGVAQARRQRGQQDRAQRIVVIVGAKLRQAQDVGRQGGAVVQHAMTSRSLSVATVLSAGGPARRRPGGCGQTAPRPGYPAAPRPRHRQAIVEQPVERRIERDLKQGRMVSGES